MAEVVDHGGHQGTAHDATGDECGERDAQRRTEASPPQVTPVVVRQIAVERGADRGPQLSVKGDQQDLIQHVSVDAHVKHKLGDISALPGEDHL